MNKRTILWLLAFLLTFNLALALGIRPVKSSYVFDHGRDYEQKFWVVNNDHFEFTATITVQGEIAEYVDLKTEELRFREDDEALPVEFSVHLPAEVPPGTSIAEIIVEQTFEAPEGENLISSKIVLKHKIFIEGPYPDKYITASLNFFENKDKIRMVAEVENLGKKNIENIQSRFYVNDLQQRQHILETEQTSLKRSENKLLDAQIARNILGRGEFEVSAVITYDDQKSELVKKLLIGQPEVEITYFDKFFIANQINQYNLDLLNKWNKKITNVFVDVEVKKEKQKIDQFRTKSIDIEGLMAERIRDYFDAQDKGPGKYSFDMIVNFWNSYDLETRTFQAELITEDEASSRPASALVGGAAGIFGSLSLLVLVVLASILASGGIFYALWRQKNKKNWSNSDRSKELNFHNINDFQNINRDKHHDINKDKELKLK